MPTNSFSRIFSRLDYTQNDARNRFNELQQYPDLPFTVDWSLWKRIEYLTLEEAVLLSLEMNPRFAFVSHYAKKYLNRDDNIRERFENYDGRVFSLCRKLEAIGSSEDKRSVANPKYTKISAEEFVSFAREFSWELPTEFPGTFRAKTSYEFPWLSPRFERFFEELKPLFLQYEADPASVSQSMIALAYDRSEGRQKDQPSKRGWEYASLIRSDSERS